MLSSFSKPRSTDWFNPSEHSDNTLAEKQDEALQLMLEKGLVYSSELSQELGVNIDETNKILFNMKKLGYMAKIYPDSEEPQTPFKSRMGELWMKGVIGYAAFMRYSWWVATEAGIEYAQAKHYKQKWLIRAGLINYYNLKVEQEVIPQEQLDKEFDEIFKL